MALRKIALQGEPCLTKVCRPVTDFNGRLHTLLDDLADTLAESGGVGLAAPQVGVLRRVCVVLDEEEQLIELVNPEIIRTEGEQTGLEGCLSVPGKYGEVTRPEIVRVRAQDRNGDWFEVEDEGLTARCFCHEIEHLDGHLFVEHTDHLLTERSWRHTSASARRRTETRTNENTVYGYARLCRGIPKTAGGGRPRRVRRVHPAG